MKAVISFFLICCFVLPNMAAWKNGPKTTDINKPFFGGHDWVAWKAYQLAKDDLDIDFIKNHQMIFFYGTETPDNGLLPGFSAEGSFSDKGTCHCILFNENGSLAKDTAAVRVKEKFERAKKAFARGDHRMAAFYVGAMAHYLGDLGQFMHLMGKQSHWGEEIDGVHGAYESVLDKLLNVQERTSDYLEVYVKEKTVMGSSSREITIELAKFVETGGGSIHDVRWMHDEYASYRATRGKRVKPSLWSAEFRDQSGANVNEAINAIAKLIKMVSG